MSHKITDYVIDVTTYRNFQTRRDVTRNAGKNKLDQLIAKVPHDVLVLVLSQSTLRMAFLKGV